MAAVFLLDSSFLIWLRQEMSDSLNDVLEGLATLVDAGVATFPRQVRDELDNVDDQLKVWTKGHWRNANRYDVDHAIAIEVFARVTEVIDTTKSGECADPWLVAQAVEYLCKEPDKTVRVVSNDYRDRAKKKSLRWACEREGVGFVRPAEFLLQLGGLVRAVREGERPKTA